MVVDGASDWKAADKWTDAPYIQNQIKLSQAQNYALSELDLDNMENATGDQIDKLNLIKEFGHGGLYFPEDGLPHFQQLLINLNNELKKDYIIPSFINDTLILKDVVLASLHEKVNDDLNGYANQVSRETYRCIVTGSKNEEEPAAKLRLISPIFKQNMYSGSR